MTYITRTGTKVLNHRAARHAITLEHSMTPGMVGEYRVTGRIATQGAPFAEDGDTLMVKANDDRPEWAYALNLVTGEAAILGWDALAHTVKPKELTV